MNEPQLSEEEIRQLQAELDRITVDDVLIQTVVTLLNVGARKSGMDPGAPVDLDQTKLAIEGARALLPILEERHGAQLGPVKDMVAQLQMAYAQAAGGGAPGGEAAPKPGSTAGEAGEGGTGTGAPKDQPPGPGGGRLWVPGQ